MRSVELMLESIELMLALNKLMLASNKLMLDQYLYLDQKNLHSDHLYILESIINPFIFQLSTIQSR